MVLAFDSKTDRLMSRIAIAIFTLGAIYGLFSFGRPLYWRFYANVLRPFEDVGGIDVLDDDPFSAAIIERQQALLNQSGKAGECRRDTCMDKRVADTFPRGPGP